MKLLLTTAAAALISTAAFADNATRYDDLRLDTSKSADTSYGQNAEANGVNDFTRADDLRLNTAETEKEADFSLSSRNELRSAGEGYIYGGFGPNNDSR